MNHHTSRSAWMTTLILAVLAACSGGGAGTTTSVTPPGTTEPAGVTSTAGVATSTTGIPDTTTSIPAGVSKWVIAPALSQMPDDWEMLFVIPYGETEELLGSAPGGENLMLGPDYGAQAPDGSWWFMDAAKMRLAHFDRSGSYLDSVVLAPELLSQGIYFQYQLPHILSDGTIVASRFGGESTDLLVVKDSAGLTTVPGTMLLKADDGETVYALDLEGGRWAIDPSGTTVEVEYFRTQTGDRYMIALSDGSVVVSLPDAGVERDIPIEATIGDGEVHASIEVGTTADGVIHLFVLGISESDESVQLAGYTWVGPDGSVGPMSPIRNPFTPADPGSPGHFGAAFGASSPWFMIIGEDGVEVYRRT